MTQLPATIDVDDVLRQIRDSLLLHPSRYGAVKIVIESEAGEEVHVLNIHSRSTPSRRDVPTLMLCPQPPPATPTLLADEAVGTDHHQQQLHAEDHGLLQRCRDQQRRIAELEVHLQQAQDGLRQHAPSSSSASAPQPPLSPAHSTDDDSGSIDTSHSSSGDEIDEDGHGGHDGAVSMTNGADDASQSSSIEAASLSTPRTSVDSTVVRRSERSKTNVDRWRPPTPHDTNHRTADPASSGKKRKTRRHQHHHDDREPSTCSDDRSMEVDSMDGEAANDSVDDDDAAEVAALIAKLREGYDKRQSIALDSVSKESLVSLRQQVLEEEGDRIPSISGQVTSLISTSTSLKMVGYYLRALLAHRLKRTSQNSYRRLARQMLGIKSPADIAAYPALYELVQHHYPTLASAGIDVWLENPIFTGDVTWTEWKRYLTKQGSSKALVRSAVLTDDSLQHQSRPLVRPPHRDNSHSMICSAVR